MTSTTVDTSPSSAARPECVGPHAHLDAPGLLSCLADVFSAPSVSDVWTCVSTAMAELFPTASALALEFVEPDRALVRASVGLNDVTRSAIPIPISPDSQAAYVIASPDTVVCYDLRQEVRFVPTAILSGRHVRSSMSVRCTTPSGNHGIIGVQSSAVGAFDDDDARLLSAAADVLTRALAVVARRVELEIASSIDSLTGLQSRGAIMDLLARRLANGQRTKVTFVDLDAFADVNERHGHVTGDRVLQRLAQRFERFAGLDATVGRLGSDEFLVIGDGDDVAETMRQAQLLVGQLEQMILVGASSTQVSASVAVATSRRDDDVGSIMMRVDRLMIEAKAAGRGQVRVDRVVPERTTPARSAAATTDESTAPSITLADVDEAIAGVRVLFQEIVHAQSGSTYGVEALARGPVGHPLEYPDRLFPSAATFGRLGELELASKLAAFSEPLPDDVPLFVNLEPSLLVDPDWLARLADTWTSSGTRRPIVAEITERAVLLAPGSLLDAVDAVRSLGWAVALDDVGARSESLAVLRLVRPDIVKLDMGLIRSDNRAHAAHVGAAVASYREAHECSIVAEGIETQRDRDLADGLGADLLQGYLFGRPASLDTRPVTVDARVTPLRAERWRIGRKADLVHVSRYVESLVTTPDAVLLTTLQHANHFGSRTRRQYSTISRRAGFVGVLGQSISRHAAKAPGVRLVDLDPDDDVCREWNVVILAPTKSVALMAVEVDLDGFDVADDDRLFRYRLVSDLAEVEEAACRLMRYF